MNSKEVFLKTSEDDCRLAKVPFMLGGLPVQVQCRLHTHTDLGSEFDRFDTKTALRHHLGAIKLYQELQAQEL